VEVIGKSVLAESFTSLKRNGAMGLLPVNQVNSNLLVASVRCNMLFIYCRHYLLEMNLNQVTISVLDVERSIEFYETLGLKLIVRALPHYARFECNQGNSTFSLHQVDKLVEASGTWIYFEVDGLDNIVKDLMEKGIVFEDMPSDKPWLWREARLKDPDNNQLILYFAGDNRKNPPWKM
jgi:catechol 2,3-dioxygenase-like lactoylglutathione lyase family enzyme